MERYYTQPYDEVDEGEGPPEQGMLLEPENCKPRHSKSRNLKKQIMLHALTFLLATAATTLTGYIIRPYPPRIARMKALHCGSNSTEARALNCTYDVLSNIWVPKPCLDRTNLNDFKRLAQWQAYETPEARRLLTEDEMGDFVEPNTFFRPIREHMVHCALMWRRLHRGYHEDQRYLDLRVKAYSHTLHCTQLMMDILEKPRSMLDKVIPQTTPGFSTCDVPG